jgi:hypothetical protein
VPHLRAGAARRGRRRERRLTLTRRPLPPALLLVGALLAGPAAPGAAEENDLRGFRVGMPAAELPAEGYTGFACADDPARKLDGWRDFAACPADARGLHAVRFRYDEAANPRVGVNDQFEGTKVAGHPVLLTLLIGGGGVVEGLVIETDPAARLFLRKKAFLFADQAKARYGEDGWACEGAPPAAGEEPVGSVFVKERCEKTAGGRRLILDRQLFRRAGQELRDFVGSTRLTILRVGTG